MGSVEKSIGLVDHTLYGKLRLVRRLSRLLVVALVVVSCGQSGPPSVHKTSEEIPDSADRLWFVKRYVLFDREIHRIEFDIYYKNNSGWLPAPSDRDIKLVVVVPEEQLDLWLSGNMLPTGAGQWQHEVAREIDVSGVTQWAREGAK